MVFCLVIAVIGVIGPGLAHVQQESCYKVDWTSVGTKECFQSKPLVSFSKNHELNFTASRSREIPNNVSVNVTSLFIQQGYDPTNIPRDLEDFGQVIIHDDRLTFSSDSQRNLKRISTSQFSNVYLAQYNKAKPVMVKVFKLTYLEHMYEVAMITSYLQDTVQTLKYLGLTRLGKTLALVQDYIPGAKTFNVFLKTNNVTQKNLISLTMQMVQQVRKVHEKFVLFNDLHLRKFLVFWETKVPKLTIKDFEQASFQAGEIHDQNSDSYLAPDITNDSTTQPSTDVYRLGNMLRKINERLQKRVIHRVFVMCMHNDPSKRPSAKDVHVLLALFLRNLVPTDTMMFVRNRKRTVTSKYLFERKNMLHVVPTMNPANLLEVRDESNQKFWLKKTKYTKIYAAELYGRLVTVKRPISDFEYIRQEAIVNLLLNDTGSIPHFYGLYPTGQAANKLSLVHELFGKGITLEVIVDDIAKQTISFQISLVSSICEIVQSFHDKGMLINNIGIDNFLIAPGKISASLRIISLNSVSGLNGVLPDIILEEIQSRNVSAPDIGKVGRTSVATDIYRVGRTLVDLKMHDGLKAQLVLLFKDCFMKGSSFCLPLKEIKTIFENMEKLQE